jgi:hypothetical protein
MPFIPPIKPDQVVGHKLHFALQKVSDDKNQSLHTFVHSTIAYETNSLKVVD